MPAKKRNKTKYPGVYWIEGMGPNRKPERIYYIVYRKGGKLIEEKAGRQYQDDMNPARAARLSAERMEGKDLPNKVKRELEMKRKEAEQNKWTISRLWEAYKADRNIKGLKIDEYRYNRYLKPVFGDKEPKELVSLDVDRLRVNMLKKQGLKPASAYNVLELLRRIINYGVKKRLCQPLPFTIEMPRVDNEKTEDLTPEQLDRLLKAIEEDPHPQAGKIMLMALYTGMRRGELFRLKWQDIDFDRVFPNCSPLTIAFFSRMFLKIKLNPPSLPSKVLSEASSFSMSLRNFLEFFVRALTVSLPDGRQVSNLPVIIAPKIY